MLAHFAAPQGSDWRHVLLALSRNPLIIACVTGLTLNGAALPIPPPIHTFLDALGRASLPIGLLLVGASVSIDGLFRPGGLTLITTALTLVVMPAVAVGFGLVLGLSDTNLAVVACCASVPSASNAYVLARQMGGDAPLMFKVSAEGPIL